MRVRGRAYYFTKVRNVWLEIQNTGFSSSSVRCHFDRNVYEL